MSEAWERPAIVEDIHLKYLDELRESGVTNMFGAGTFVSRRFGVDKADASTILGYWMDSFTERYPN